jgi:hypothetical protein
MTERLLIALASFPRSGNTWARFLIEQATGELCGSVYRDRIMPRADEGIVIKTHMLDSDRYDRAIHIVRDPFDAIESYFHWRRDVANEAGVAWSEHVPKATEMLREHTAHWVAASCPTHVIRYEDLKTDPVHVLSAGLAWIGKHVQVDAIRDAVRASELTKMRDMHGDLGQRFFRRGEVGKGIESFNAEERAHVRESLADHLHRFGYTAPSG